jgi:hypothetical protein
MNRRTEDALNFACARWLLVIFVMPPLHRSQFDGQTFVVGPQRPVVTATLDRSEAAKYAYDNDTRFTVTPDTILPNPHSMSLAVTIFEGPSESRQDLKATTLLTARNSKKTCR